MTRHFIGIDVQDARDCPYAVMDASARVLETGWLARGAELEREAIALARSLENPVFGIDSPRIPLETERDWYWRSGAWRRREREVGHGRHCEVVVSAFKLANPQWTPLRDRAPAWMNNGFRLFEALDRESQTHEVFPTAAYTQLRDDRTSEVRLSFADFRPGPKDMLDAVVAAYTVAEFITGRGSEVGGGDGLGTIVLPRPIEPADHPVLSWPG